MSTLTVQLLPDDDARCQIIDDARCERYSFGAKLTGTLTGGQLVTVKLCTEHAARVAQHLSGERIIGSTRESS